MDNITNIKTGALLLFGLLGGAVGQFLGGWDTGLKVLLGIMGIDILTGVMIAIVWKVSPKTDTGGLESNAMFKGLCRKAIMVMVIGVCTMLDQMWGINTMRMAAIFFFIGNEGISLLENLGLMGVPYPAFLKNALEALRDKGDDNES